MNVLVITGDKSFKAGHPRFDVQAKAIEKMVAVYWGAGALWPHIPEGSFNVVSTQDPFFRGLFGWFLSRQLKTGLNVQVHADIQKQSFLKRTLAPFILRRADSIRVVSEGLKQSVERMGVRGAITVLPVFVDIEPFKRIQRSPGEEPTILWVGRFEDEKDPVRAIDILKEVRKNGVDAKLIMLGTGSLENKIRSMAKNLPVEFPGWHPSIEYLPKAHIVLSTSRAESWGASIIEALAAGVPVVAPDVGVAREAGATVVSKDALAGAVLTALETNASGQLKIPMLSKEEWTAAWRQSLG